MAPRGQGTGGPRLLSTLSSPAFDGPFSIWTGTYHEKDQDGIGENLKRKFMCVIEWICLKICVYIKNFKKCMRKLSCDSNPDRFMSR